MRILLQSKQCNTNRFIGFHQQNFIIMISFFSFLNPKKKQQSHDYIVTDSVMFELECRDQIQENTNYQTKETIKFGKMPFGGTSNTLFELKGKCFNKKVLQQEPIEQQVIIYKRIIHNRKRRSIHYFHNNRFVIGIYLYTNAIQKDANSYAIALKEKYKLLSTTPENCFCICDAIGGSVLFDYNKTSVQIIHLSPHKNCTQDFKGEKRNEIDIALKNRAKESF